MRRRPPSDTPTKAPSTASASTPWCRPGWRRGGPLSKAGCAYP